MRCTNCGWDNAADVLRCVKCNFPLNATAGPGPLAPPPAAAEDANIGKTIVVNPSEATPWDGPAPAPMPAAGPAVAGVTPCIACGYVLAAGTTECPACGQDQQRQPAHKVIHEAAPRPAAADGAAGTIDPYRKGSPERFRLTLVTKDNEASGGVVEFTGAKVALNRDNLEPNNPTLTTKVQATIAYIDGQWLLLDESSLKTTFVQAGRAIALQKGDIILMGDRKFIFDH